MLPHHGQTLANEVVVVTEYLKRINIKIGELIYFSGNSFSELDLDLNILSPPF